MSSDWYCLIGDREFGPLDSRKLRHLARSGQLSESCPVRKGAEGQWVPAQQVRGLLFDNASNSSDPVASPLTRTEAPPQFSRRHASKPLATLLAIAAACTIFFAFGLAFFLGRQSAIRPVTEHAPSEAMPQSAPLAGGPATGRIIWDDVDQSHVAPAKTAAISDSLAPADEIPKSEPTDARRAIAMAEKAVVMLDVAIKDAAAKYGGSGFIFTGGVLVTNYHVIEEASSVLVKFQDGRQAYASGWLAIDQENDLALIECDTHGIECLMIGRPPSKLDAVFAIGSPRGVSGTISNGIVSGIGHWSGKAPLMIQTTAPISPGSSGGPLLNEGGEVIGVITETLTDAQNMNFAVAAVHVAQLLDSAKQHAQPWRNLPSSASAARRAQTRQIQARVEELLSAMAANKKRDADLSRKKDHAQRILVDRKAQVDRLHGQLEVLIVAGYNVAESPLKADYDKASSEFMNSWAEREKIGLEIIKNSEQHGEWFEN